VVSKAASLLLLTAGVLKVVAPAAQASTEPAGAFLIVAAWVEILLGLWLLLSFSPRPTRWLAVAAFAVLLGAALVQAGRGDASCKCFGHFSVNPWVMVLLDASMVAALLAVPVEATSRPPRWRSAAACIAAVTATIAGAYSAYAFLSPVTTASEAVILTNSTWVQQAHMIFEDADNGEELRRGEWVILLHRRGCPACAEALEQCCQRAAQNRQGNHPLRIALVEIPDENEEGAASPDTGGLLAIGRLRGQRPWVVQTPFFLRARDGHVYQASEQLADLDK
jgi:uncharacterized membrane protein YphA (DoxX/SURF4 family)